MTDPTVVTVTTGTSSLPHGVVGTISFRYSSLRGIPSDSLTTLIESYLDVTPVDNERRSGVYTSCSTASLETGRSRRRSN